MKYLYKDVIAAILILVLTVALAGCGGPDVRELTEQEQADIEAPAFSLDINGKVVTDADLSGLKLYVTTANSTNSYGTKKSKVYVGYNLSDVLAAAGVKDGYKSVKGIADDGYSVELNAKDAKKDSTFLAITEDDKPFSKGPWLAPCASKDTPDYVQNVTKITVEM